MRPETVRDNRKQPEFFLGPESDLLCSYNSTEGPQMVRSERTVPIALRQMTVTENFRSVVYRAARRAGMHPSEFLIAAAGSRLRELGYDFGRVFPRSHDEQAGETQVKEAS